MKNRIPRQFNRITGKMLINTNMDQPGDIIHVWKNCCSTGYLALNTRTGKYAYMFVSMLRDGNIFQLTEIV